ncbi:reverse transcriptase family protein [Flavobacterium cyclinae]|uniref:reverse transcriptase family protein n=1 Tax=Flavobacterium cyclinae TaxID=2895947 RepID=UPI001E551660|nr:reverse transcriptase family protein [Flavobacterium cyclinae]UGS19905.1 reverse transcriptase family protein [Flavobacterium cyclinae]
MILTPEFKFQVQTAFKEMQSKSDFLELLNIAKQMMYGDKTVPFSEKQLNYFITKDSQVIKSRVDFRIDLSKFEPFIEENVVIEKKNINRKDCYVPFIIKKKSGQDRTIHAPVKGLKEFQKALNIILQCLHEPHTAATGFVIGKSIVDNAKKHIGQTYVYNIDLKDFFPSVDRSRVWGRLLVAPFNLGTTVERKNIANFIATLCCTPMEVERFKEGNWIKITTSVLPQGAPTSPTLTNIICEKLDKRLNGVAKRFGLNYSRYADDITFSSKHNAYEVSPTKVEKIFASGTTFDCEVRKIITEQNFHIKETKVRLQKRGYRQEVTGLVVNDKINVTRLYVKQLRQWLYLWERYGYDKSYAIFLNIYLADKGHVKSEQPNMAMVIEGKLLYLKMVKGADDGTYLKLKKRFDLLLGTTSKNNSEAVNILDLIFDVGLDEAMTHYKK